MLACLHHVHSILGTTNDVRSDHTLSITNSDYFLPKLAKRKGGFKLIVRYKFWINAFGTLWSMRVLTKTYIVLKARIIFNFKSLWSSLEQRMTYLFATEEKEACNVLDGPRFGQEEQFVQDRCEHRVLPIRLRVQAAADGLRHAKKHLLSLDTDSIILLKTFGVCLTFFDSLKF